MKAVILGPSETASGLSVVVERRGVEVIRQLDVTVVRMQELMRETAEPPDLYLLIADGHLQQTTAILSELQQTSTGKAIVFGVGRSAGEVVQIMRAGAIDYIEMSGDFVADIDDSLKRLTQARTSHSRTGKIISALSATGGSGQTAVAVNLAITFAATHRAKTLAVDMNLAGGDVCTHLALTPHRSLVDCPRNPADVHAVKVLPLIEKHRSGLSVLAGPDYLGQHGTVSPDVISALLKTVVQAYDYIVLDLEDVYHSEQAAAVSMSDVLLVVLRGDFPSLMRTKRLLEHLNHQACSNIRLVVNKSTKGVSIPDAKIESILKQKIDVSITYEPASVLNGINMGEPAVTEFPRSKFSRAVSKLAADLLAPVSSQKLN